MKRKVLSIAVVSAILAGCHNEEHIGISPPPVTPPPPAYTYIGSLLSSGILITGEVDCNGTRVDNGLFEVLPDTTFDCRVGPVILGEFTAPPAPEEGEQLVPNEQIETSFELTSIKGRRVTEVLQSIDSCENDKPICLTEIDAFDISEVYLHLDDDKIVDAYLASLAEKDTDEVGKAPSSHVDDKVVPVVSPGTSTDLNAKFVSANAEATYAYKPSAEGKVLTRSKLTDANGQPLVGVSYFSASSSGVTDENGEFEYLWGDQLTFGIDTFEFGRVSGNKLDYKITEVTDNPVTQSNIQALIERYAVKSNGKFEITKKIQDTFAMYPNVINELINLSLPNGGKLEGTDFNLPSEFEEQFDKGLTAIIDEELRQPERIDQLSRSPQSFSLDGGKYVTESLNAIFRNVPTFHVFNDNMGPWGQTGVTRGMRGLNLSNRAFPVMMPRTDRNKELDFGEQQAWTREGRAYIAEWPGVDMPEIPLVSKDNATFGLPFITAGEIGQGKIVVMGNSLYPNVLACPDNYWNSGAVLINSAEKKCETKWVENANHDDNGSMKQFFVNLFQWLNHGESIQGLNVATNIDKAHLAIIHNITTPPYDFFIHPSYGLGEVTQFTKGSFSGISPTDTPLLILQAYPVKFDGYEIIADLSQPNLTQDDISALIDYVHQGGNIVMMDALKSVNPEPIGRLTDAAGIAAGGANVTPTKEANCGNNAYCKSPYPVLHAQGQQEMVVLERFQDVDGKQPFTVHQDGTVEWLKDESKIKFEIPTYQAAKRDSEGKPELDSKGNTIMETKYARIFVNSAEEREAAIKELQAAFEGTPVCNNAYEYEFNCIEARSGHGYTARGNAHRRVFDRYQVNKDVIDSMVKAASLGANFTALYNHELYYRTKGKQGARLATTELNQTYDNLSVWMWNDNPYRYDPTTQDELGFKETVQFLNCYKEDQHQSDVEEAKCPAELKASLIEQGMIHGEGELQGQLNPSFPLNYMEKPLTRIMLGRSYWDHNITVDTTKFPGRTTGSTTNAVAKIQTDGKGVSYSAGNNQSTGYWAPQLQEVSIAGGVEATITVMMADDLTGLAKHETGLKRPPRMQTSYEHDGQRTTFKTPYGGLIYIKPKERDLGEVTFSLEGVESAAFWKDGQWVTTPEAAAAPLAEIDTGTFIYTTPVKNVENLDVDKFAAEMNRFAEAASDFYGRDQVTAEGTHRRFTYDALKGYRHRFVNDVQISIGSAHSGYPVMNSGFNANANNVPTNPLNDWLIWHEVGHNLAVAPFVAEGSTEVTNNLLALYMQELEGRNENPRMDRIILDIQKAPLWLQNNPGHAWSHGDAGMRLVMFGQLKLWAKAHFKIDDWYSNSQDKPTIYGSDEGWNMVKLMHRKARGDNQGDQGVNYCSANETTLTGGDLMMVCSSYVSGYDLRDFFTTWNVGETSMTTPEGTKQYNGGISNKGLEVLDQLKLSKPKNSPLKVDSLNYSL
ncbi:SslE/AcfD family lipoprotein zinc metalloprotease [Vibrio vulnificus]